jgi:hypothetical protein
LFFGIAAIGSKGIALPLGFHFGLNWMQSLFGMKTQYASSMWTIVPGLNDGALSVEFVGVVLQGILLVLGVVVIEVFLRRQSRALADLD